jgi:hypothetical protein
MAEYQRATIGSRRRNKDMISSCCFCQAQRPMTIRTQGRQAARDRPIVADFAPVARRSAAASLRLEP